MARVYDYAMLRDPVMLSNSTDNGFCGGSPIFDVQMTWNNTWPHFTECFQNTVLILLPCAWLWLTCPFYIWYLISHCRSEVTLSRLNVTKCILIALLAVISLIVGVKAIIDHNGSGESSVRDDVISPIIQSVTLAFLVIMMQVQRKHGVITSAISFIFWVLEFVTGLVPFYSKIILQEYEDDMFGFILFYLDFALVLILLVLHCFAEKPPPDPSVVGKACPETQCSLLSLITFAWMTPLILLGYKRPLVEEDVYDLNPTDKCRTIIPRFTHSWMKQIHRLASSRNGLILKLCNPPIQSKVHNERSSEEMTEKTPLLNGAISSGSVQTEQSESKASSPRMTKAKLSIFRAIFKTFGWSFLFTHMCSLAWVIFSFIFPLLLNSLINFTSDLHEPMWKGYMYACLVFVVGLGQSVCRDQQFFWGNRLGMRVNTAVIALVYRKALTMTSYARKDTTVGEIVNLMAVDAHKVADRCVWVWISWASPLRIILSIVFLYLKLGISIFAGLTVIVLMIPVNFIVTRKTQALQDKQMIMKDRRINMISEILNGIKILKLYAWERSFMKKVEDIRKQELVLLRRALMIFAYTVFCWTMIPGLVALLSFMTYIFTSEDHYLSPDKAFVSISYLNILHIAVNSLPLFITKVARANVSLERLNRFLSNEDIDPDNVQYDNKQADAVTIENGSFQWDHNRGAWLKNINLTFPEGKLVAIVGQVGCGKSSLISAMLGEMEKLSGKVSVKGHMAYVPQDAWIQNGTLRDNITFGKEVKYSEYNNVLDVCALRPDLDILAAGDMTEIGEKGINLSGGQKQRVSLARAVYNDADIYLLDDPLSAVDAHVGKHIFEQVISDDGLLKSKTRILVTHGVHWLPKVDQIIVIVDGSVTEIGSYEELLANDGPFAQFLRTYLIEHKDETLETDIDDPDGLAVRGKMLKRLLSIQTDSALSGDEDETVCDHRKIFYGSSEHELQHESRIRHRTISRNTSRVEDLQKHLIDSFSAARSQQIKDDAKPIDTLIDEEEAEVGSVKHTTYHAYLKAMTYWRAILGILFFALFTASLAGSSIWLQHWTDDTTLANMTISLDNPEKQRLNNMYLAIYGLFTLLQGIFILGFSIMLALCVVKGSQTLHDGMLKNILKSPMSFFDTTPIGRIINRFSRDIDNCDEDLAFYFIDFFEPLFDTMSTIVIISINLPIVLAVLLPVMIVFYVLQRFYVATSRQLKRVESTTRSPIFNHFSETLNGVTVIRAYRQQDRFVSTCDRRMDNNNVFFIYGQSSSRWLGIVVGILANLVIFAATMFAVTERDTLTAGIMGLTISYAQQLIDAISSLVRAKSDIETNIVSVERIVEYTNTPTETSWTIPEFEPPSAWPQHGAISIQDYMTRYRPGLNLVLKGINADIKAGEKVGIVGRTGAGKSSLTLALFRIIESAGGRIEIDDRNIADMGLHDLRKRLTILPQDPVLFSGSLRMNLDPFDDYSDEQIWKAIDHAHLKSFVTGLPNELMYECGEGGQNLSVGQRQLFCLARSLLKKTKILILDEATAAVDMETDDIIQRTIQDEFKDCTIIAIAHRLNTIMDYDRIMVFHDGLLKEYDSPSNLLQDTNSTFYDMAKNAGLVKAMSS